MTSMTNRNRPASSRRLAALLLSASGLALVTAPASAQEVVFSDNGTNVVNFGQRVAQASGVTQVRLPTGVMLSFVDSAEYTIANDGTLDLHKGSVTVAGAAGGAGVIRMPDGAQATVSGAGSAGSFTVTEDGQSSGHTLSGIVRVTRGRNDRNFDAGEQWASAGRSGLRQTVSNGAQATPSVTPVRVARLDRGGPAAAAENGLPVTLGDALAAAGASSDILGAARNVEAAAGNPDLATFPSGDLALLVAAAGQLEGLNGGAPFPQAQADIIRTYLGFLASGGSGANFLTAYAGFVTQYLDLLRSGALPSGFDAASVGDINAFLAYQSRVGALGSLAGQDRVLVEAYLAFLAGGGNPDGFTAEFTGLVEAYFAFIRGGGDPADFGGASAQVIDDYIAFLNDSGLLAQLSESNQALLAAYLANGGLGFAGDYQSALDAYFAFLAAGNLPSDFSAQDAAALQAYLEALQAAGLFDTLLGAQADFFADYLAFVQGGGDPDDFGGLNANVFAGYASQLQAYYDYLLTGGVPSAYGALTQEQIAAYIAALEAAGATGAFLPDLGAFYSAYADFLANGGNPDIYTGLPVLNLPVFADALNAYADFLANGGLPSDFTATDLDVLANYLAALDQSGQLATLLGANADLLNAYFAYLGTGANADLFAGLPVYADYVGALQAYYAFLDAGGLPGDYTALTPQQVQDYLAALASAGGLATQLGDLGTFYTQYFAFISAGGNPAEFAGLPLYDTYASALQAYFAFLAGGGLPADYTALTQQQISAYLAALNAAGGFNLQIGGDAGAFFTSYFAFLQGGGDPAEFAALPIYADYVSALNSYFAFLAGGGLPADYTALTQQQIEAYLAALAQVQGGFGAFAGLSDFFDAYYAFIQGGGDPAEFAGLPVYSDYLAAIDAFYTYLLNGGLPSGYTALTQQQIEAYLAALANAGLLSGTYTGDQLAFFTNYLAFLAGGGNPDTFGNLPGSGGLAPVLANVNIWTNRASSAGAGTTDEVAVTSGGQITRIGSTGIDLTQQGYVLGEFGRIGNDVAWTRYRDPGVTNRPNANIHYLTGAPAVNLPASGQVNYQLVGGTAPTDILGAADSTGYFTGDLAVAFGSTTRVGVDFDVYASGNGWNFQTTGGVVDASQSQMSVDGNGRFFLVNATPTGLEGAACSGLCRATVLGGLFGDGATSAGFIYHIDDSGTGTNYEVRGSAVFSTGGTAIAGIGTPPPQPATTLPNQSIAYANKLIGDDVHTLSNVTYNADGIPIGYEARIDANEALTSGDMTLADTGTAGNGALSWARWTDGTPGGFWYTVTLQPVGPNGGYHVIAGDQLTNMPMSGAIAYDLIGYTTPTRHDESTATGSVSGGAAVVFGVSPVVALDLDITSGTESFNLFTTGKLTDPTQSTLAINPADGMFHTLGQADGFPSSRNAVFVESADAFCASSCTGFVEGFLAGDGASHMGLAYSIRANTVPNSFIDGTAAFAAGAAIDLGGGIGTGTPLILGDAGDFDTGAIGTVGFAGPYNSDDEPVRFLDASGAAATIAATGDVRAFQNTFTTFDAGTSSSTDISGNTNFLIGRWQDGTVGSNFYADKDLNAAQGIHYLVAAPLSPGFTLPTSGRVDYELLAATAPTVADGTQSPGQFEAGMSLLFNGANIGLGFEATITIPDDAGDFTYFVQTPGGLTDPSQSFFELLQGGDPSEFSFTIGNGYITASDGGCAGECRFNAELSAAGSDISQLGMVYNAKHPGRDYGQSMSGAAIFGATGPLPGTGGGGNSGGGDNTSNFTGTREGIVYYTFLNGSLASAFGGSADLENGGLTRFTSILGTVDHASADIVEAGDLGDVAWARWTNGTVESRTILGDADTQLDATGGYHVMAGNPTIDLPSGTIAYELIGGTSATDDRGSAPGTLTGDLAIDFATLGVGYDLSMEVGGMGWAVSTNGGAADPSSSQFAISVGSAGWTFGGTFANTSSTITGTGDACVGTCIVNVSGTLFGANADYAALAMNVIDTSAQNGTIGASGLAIFGQEGAASATTPSGDTSAWARWEVPAGGSTDPVVGSDAMMAPGMDALAASGIQYSAEQIAQLEAYLSRQIN